MADLTPVNCAGSGDGCIEVGRDVGSATPAKLLIQSKLDPDYLKCTPDGYALAIRNQVADVPVAAVPSTASGPGNMMRIVNDGTSPGIYVPAPIAIGRGNGTRVGATGTLGNYSAVSHTVTYANPDSVARLAEVNATYSMIAEEGNNTTVSVFIGVVEAAFSIADVNGNTTKEYALTLTGDTVSGADQIMNGGGHFVALFEVPAGATLTVTFRIRTVRHDNVITSGTGRGFLIYDSWVKSQQGLVL